MKKLVSFVAALIASGLVAGCMVGPNYQRPVVQTPTAYRDTNENAQLYRPLGGGWQQ
jgi:hypothetical protein